MEDKKKAAELEKIVSLGSGADYWMTKEDTVNGIPSLRMTDGPHGLRNQTNDADTEGVNHSKPAVCFPTASLTACSFDEDLLAEEGKAIAQEARDQKVGMVLGPGANIKRNPLCGRNFEYFSEDPLVSGTLAAGWIRGCQSEGISCCLKHFACNNQEYDRFISNSMVDERTEREIYLRPFEIAVKKAHPWAVMCSYNKVNGVYSSVNKKLLTDILRKEWGFDGMVVTDWGAMHNRIDAYRAGCDLGMPGGAAYMEKECAQLAAKDDDFRKTVEESAERVRAAMRRGAKTLSVSYKADYEADHDLAGKVAAESIVLLKNEDTILPLGANDSVCLIGDLGDHMRYQGSGSSHVNAIRVETLRNELGDLPYAPGYDVNGNATDDSIQDAVELAKKTEKVIVVAGLPVSAESEGFDRTTLAMPEGIVKTVEAVAKVNSNVIVILLAGGVLEVPFADDVKAILYAGLPGEAGASALRKILYGEVNPSGRLAESWPMKYEDVVNAEYYGDPRSDAEYREGIYVGWRYYEKAHVPVRFAFGQGLSYTSFECTDLKVDGRTVAVTVENTGKRAGKHTVLLYVRNPEGGYREARKLVGFRKIKIEPGQSVTVTFTLDDRDFSIYEKDHWEVIGGNYSIEADDKRAEMTVEGNELPEGPSWYTSLEGKPDQDDFEELLGSIPAVLPIGRGHYSMDNTLRQLSSDSKVAQVIVGQVCRHVKKACDGDDSSPEYRMLLSAAIDIPLSSIEVFGRAKQRQLEGLVDISNGSYWRGIWKEISSLFGK